ncbi:hypothetical protein P8T65_06920 [Streptomyces sp. 11x1]|nr:hypothetical protein [Streptomyces sp. 11x1]WNZ07345.1 hypothetical protein P8T65_06920 [Streptomyces sp. 11x1]
MHGEDIRRPLGIERDYPIGTLTTLADHHQRTDLPLFTKSRIRGLRLTATDSPFATGQGPRVSSTTLALIMAMAGCAFYFDALDGDGVALLRERQAHHGHDAP